MKKRILTGLLALVLIMGAVLPALAAGKTYYVWTDNGKTLNLRSAMKTGASTFICRIPYGAAVTVHAFHEKGKWAEVEYKGQSGYVMGKYLQETKPSTSAAAKWLNADGSSASGLKFETKRFNKDLKLNVYSGPGSDYVRGANGKAVVSTNDTIKVAGKEGSWALVMYETNKGSVRVGYVSLKAHKTGITAKELDFSYERFTMDSGTCLTDDPYLGKTELAWVGEGEQVILLSTYSTKSVSYAYVEYNGGAAPVRGFVPWGCLAE